MLISATKLTSTSTWKLVDINLFLLYVVIHRQGTLTSETVTSERRRNYLAGTSHMNCGLHGKPSSKGMPISTILLCTFQHNIVMLLKTEVSLSLSLSLSLADRSGFIQHHVTRLKITLYRSKSFNGGRESPCLAVIVIFSYICTY